MNNLNLPPSWEKHDVRVGLIYPPPPHFRQGSSEPLLQTCRWEFMDPPLTFRVCDECPQDHHHKKRWITIALSPPSGLVVMFKTPQRVGSIANPNDTNPSVSSETQNVGPVKHGSALAAMKQRSMSATLGERRTLGNPPGAPRKTEQIDTFREIYPLLVSPSFHKNSHMF